MSRYSDVIKTIEIIVGQGRKGLESRVATNVFLLQISETLAKIYDDGFATQIELECERRDDGKD